MQANIIAAKKIASLMLEIRQLSKELSTYYTSVEELIYPDGCVHPQFNHTATATGRLSCKGPNVQNSPSSAETKVPEHFVSRFNKQCFSCKSDMDFRVNNPGQATIDIGWVCECTAGVLLSADYSSIEPRIEAQLSGDVQKISDIINGVDDHVKNLALKEGKEYGVLAHAFSSGDSEVASRRAQIKGFTFATQYGAGNKKIAEMTGFSEEEVQNIKDARKRAYPRLHMYYDWMQTEVNRTGQYSDPWGRIYKFKKYPPKFHWQKQDSYSPNEIMNFRTQGHATGNIVLVMLGIFWRTKALLNRDKYLLINTIHDSVMLDCKYEYVDQAYTDLKVLETVKEVADEYFNDNIIVPIQVEISHGKSWADLS